jgi:hypothetical protein
MVQGWKRIPILLCVEFVGVSTIFNKKFGPLVKGLLEFGWLRFGELVGKLVSMGCDGSFVFQDHQMSVTM